MDFSDLRAFVQVARLGSFARAATHLRVAQSALSRRVARLEHQLGLQLLTRHGRGARPTARGLMLLEKAQKLISDLETFERNLGSLTEMPVGQVRLAMPPSTGQVLAPRLLAACYERFPRLELQLREGFGGAIHKWLDAQEVDIALIYEPEESAEIETVPLVREPLFLIAPLAPGPSLPPVDVDSFDAKCLAQLPLILPGRAHSIRTLLERYAADRDLRLHIVHEVDGISTTKGLVAAGFGYTVFSYAGVYEEMAQGALRIIPFAPPLHWTLTMAHNVNASPSVALLRVKELIEAEAHTLLSGGRWQGRLVAPPPRAA